MSKALDKWKARLDWINDEIPFGPKQLIYNEDGNLHCDDGPAMISPTRCICYSNGRKNGYDIDIWGSIIYYYENVLIPTKWFLQPDKITLKEVFNHPNTEVRYVGAKLYGYDKLLKSKKVKIIHEDDQDRILFTIDGIFSEPVAIVKVVNSSPEPDGTYEKVFLIVPPNMKTCHEAVAWTFRKEPKDYHPDVET